MSLPWEPSRPRAASRAVAAAHSSSFHRRAAHHRLVRTPPYVPEEGEYYTGAWSEAHRAFHRTLLEGCGNPALLETFDRLWTAAALTDASGRTT